MLANSMANTLFSHGRMTDSLGCSHRTGEDRDKLIGFANKRSHRALAELRSIDQTQPIECFTGLFRSDRHLVHEVRTTLRGPCLLVVGSAARCSANKLRHDMSPGGILRQPVRDDQNVGCERQQTVSNVVALHDDIYTLTG